MFSGIAAFGWALMTDGGPGIESQPIEVSDPEYRRAVEEAHARIAELKAAIGGPESRQPYILVPVPEDSLNDAVRTPEGRHAWGVVTAYNDGYFEFFPIGYGYDEDDDEDELAPYITPEKDLIDWRIVDRSNDSIHGSFLAIARFRLLELKKVRLNRTRRAERARFIDIHS